MNGSHELDILPDSIKPVGTYLQFELPAKLPGEPYEPAEKLAHSVVVFLLTPFHIASGATMAPAVHSRILRYAKLFGGRQGARSPARPRLRGLHRVRPAAHRPGEHPGQAETSP